MTNRKPAKKQPLPSDTLEIVRDETKTAEEQKAEVVFRPAIVGGVTARTYSKGMLGDTGLKESIKVLQGKIEEVKAGDMSHLEATLTAQVAALNAMFGEFARRGALNMGEYLNAAETYIRLALKAQAQTVRTVEVLAAMKNPPVVFAKQANIAHGHQQVNNGLSANSAPHAGKTVDQSNELLREEVHAPMDIGGKAAAGTTHTQLETVGKIDRPED